MGNKVKASSGPLFRFLWTLQSQAGPWRWPGKEVVATESHDGVQQQNQRGGFSHLMMKKVCMIMCFMVKCSACQHMD